MHETADDLLTDNDPAMAQFPPQSAITVGVIRLRTNLMKHFADMRVLIRSKSLLELVVEA
ncbi:hypothetical protein [Corynebacterium belfantii]|uniref:hypothetical protein n=1 Tax=Corynebacterium belfantii TaxID=2014537 RepID=UPI00399CD362